MNVSQNQTSQPAPTEPSRRYRRPYYDVLARDEDYELRVVMPGVGKDGVNVQLHGRNLQIDGQRGGLRKETWRPLFRELNWDDYRLNLELNVDVNESAIAAKIEDGVLHLTLPKAEEAKPRRIEIS